MARGRWAKKPSLAGVQAKAEVRLLQALGCLSLLLPRSLAWLPHVQPAAQHARLCPGQIFRGHRVTQIVLNLFLEPEALNLFLVSSKTRRVPHLTLGERLQMSRDGVGGQRESFLPRLPPW